MIKSVHFAIFSVLLLSLVGCTQKLGGDDFQEGEVGEISQTFSGTIIEAKRATFHGTDGSLGTGGVVGGVAGAALGSLVGSGKGRMLGGVLGGLAGGAGGHLAEQQLKKQEGMRYQIQFDNGDLVVVTQGLEPKLSVGQRILVVKGAKRSRVVPDARG
ncbi:MAG: glycine zipper 2TM domain-containing protein [Alphaproteobacteria bacterium]